MQNVLLVVAKKPTPGLTKTRLCPPLNSEQAAELYECFLRDTLGIMRSVPEVRSKIVYLPHNARNYFENLAPDMDLLQQQGDSLGERLDNLLTDVLLDGADKAVVINSDSPTLPAEYLVQSFEQLSTTDVVLGPAEDGGYYLIGMKEPQPHLLRNVKMSTPNVLQETLEIARETNVTASLLPEWYDVDTVEELHRLRNDVSALQNNSCPHTRAWMQRYTNNLYG
ncbi:MAG: TIGR04282 family arsenosugar biosynthesis glycosyltransferase [Anaerolineales bacterium]